MSFIAWITALLLLIGAGEANLAHAQAPQSASQDEEARALFEAGKVAYEAGRYADALGYFQRSFDLSHRVALQYNLGLAYDRLRRDREALSAYQAFLGAESDPARAAEVQNRVRALEASLAEEEANEKARAEAAEKSKLPLVPAQESDARRTERTRKRRLWAGIAAGVVAVGAGVIISVLASKDDPEARPKPNSGVTIEALTWR